MFKTLKIYVGQTAGLEFIISELVNLGYVRHESASEEGDFSRRGGIIDIFPFTFELPIRIDFEQERTASIKTYNPENGAPLWEHRMAIILPLSKTSRTRSLHFKEEFPVENFVDLNIGDYVVHSEHGIGKFLGVEKIKIQNNLKDHLVLEYDNQEKLYVPVDKMNLVQKYMAFQIRRPKLYKLGNREWQRTKERARKGIQKLAWELLSLEAMRLSVSGFAYSKDTEWQKQFDSSFPYKETPDQEKAANEVKADMESFKPMDRLLCGDVGYGKTEVSMRAAFKAIMDNKQVAYLVPTTILAEQHYQNFSRRLSDFPVDIQLLCRFKTDSQQKEIIGGLAEGKVDVVIGTHRLLSGDIKFKDLGLVIIDEEQRFGVKAKEKLKALRMTCDVLTLTATPIPRTLYMSLMGAKNLSVINTPPQNRLPVETFVVEYDLDLIRQAILRELKRKGQVFFVHNRIENIGKVKEKLSSIIPLHARLAVAHGRVQGKVLEGIMSDFLNAKIDVLISTMIIESGIDIPNANTIIVNNAHNFGLSDLHQLRGRVGRFNKSAYAYFIIPKNEVLDTDARRRLEAIQEYSYLGAGFKIAMEDLEIRGAGNLLGIQQHGFIQAIGFDLYCRLLREAIGNFKKAGVFNG